MKKVINGFTLIELLVVVLIIGVLASVALPQYQKAVLKSRYSAMMPIGKALAEGNEVYYLEHGAYASLLTQLDVASQSSKYPDGTQVSIPQEDESLSYVLVTNDSVPNARYLVYQKHSENFADTTMCEAGDDRANELCQALGGQPVTGGGNSLGSTDWTAYVLSGTLGAGDHFMTPEEKIQAIVEEKCPSGNCTWFSDDNNETVTICLAGSILRNGDCYANETCTCPPGMSACVCAIPYKQVYDQNGRRLSISICTSSSSSTNSCTSTSVSSYTYNEDGSFNSHDRSCTGRVPNCTGARGGYDRVWSASNQRLSEYTCTAYCAAYSAMQEWNYDNGTKTRTCTQINGKT